MQMMYPIIGNRSNVALALGFGFASQNYYINQLITTTPESIGFSPIPDSVSYRKYKLNTNYLTIPLELRIRTNPDPHYRRSFKIYPGFRLGGLVNGHTKYVGDDLNTGEQIKVKEYHIRHLEKLNYGLTLRIGYGKIMLHGYYSLTELFDKTYTGSIHPFEVGLSLVLF